MSLAEVTKLQQIASDPNNSAWVFASAGSGKTKVLTDRVLRLLLEGVAPDKILCLTFTNNAAIEMQNRVNQELAKWVLYEEVELQENLLKLTGKNPDKKTLQRAQTLLIKVLDDEAKLRIQTIHAFCQNLIRLFPLEAKLRPDFEVLEPIKEQMLLKQAQSQLIQMALSEKQKSIAAMIGELNAKLHESNLDDLTAKIVNKKDKLQQLKENLFGIENVIGEIFATLDVKPSDNAEKLLAEFLSEFDFNKISLLASSLENSKSKTNREKIALPIKKFLNQQTLQNFYHFRSALFTNEGTPRKISDKEGKDENLLSIADATRQKILHFDDKFNSLQIAQDTALLIRFCDLVIENYNNLKKRNGFLDYNDLIHESNRLLANPTYSEWVKFKMDGAFDHILIDESQDTNHQQWAIIKALSEDFFSGLSASNKKRSIFIVGDEKQSIYSFQGAEPHISEEIFAYFQNRLGENLKKIELNNSFRSSKAVLGVVDAVFGNEKQKRLISKVSEFQNHQPIRNTIGKVEIWSQVNVEKEREAPKIDWEIVFENQEKDEGAKIVAQKIATKIQEIVAAKQVLPSTQKYAEYSDFMVLLRNRTNGFSQILERTFHQNAIPFTSINKLKFSESLLVQDLLAAAKFVLLQSDDLNCACLLKSPFIRISEERLLELCIHKNRNNLSLYQAIQALEGYEEIQKFLSDLIILSQKSNCFEFFSTLLGHNNCQKFINIFGIQGAELLDKFIIIVSDFNKNFSSQLQKFLEAAQEIDFEIPLSSSQKNCVQISTIHAAKGLQAPIVFLPDCAYNFNQLLSTKETITFLPTNSGLLPLWCRKAELQNQFLKEQKQNHLKEVEEEFLRLLYVAMTRAEDELYIGAFGKSHDEKSWYEIIRNSLPQLATVEIKDDPKPTPNTKNYPSEEINFSSIDKIFLNNHSSSKGTSDLTTKATVKGKIIHKILEILGKNHREDKNYLRNLIEKIIAREENLDEKQKSEIGHLAFGFIASQQFDYLFSDSIRCEVEITSINKNEVKIKRLDLVKEKENEILIVDYKSDENAPSKAPSHYIEQLQQYSEALQKIYPNKKVSSAILWLQEMRLELL